MRPCLALFLLFLLPAIASNAHAHAIHYQVESRGISARIFYDPKEPAGYAAYELFGPQDTMPHQKGRTDRNGFISFLPDRPGTWRIKVMDEAEHGVHGAEITVQVTESLYMASFDKPLVAQHTKAFVGISILLFAFGLWVLISNRRKPEP